MRLGTTILLISCISIASCAATTIEGRWRCDDTDVEHELFVVHSDNRVNYSSDGTYLSEFHTTFDFVNHGEVSVMLLLSGTWALDGNVLVETREQSRVTDFSTTTDFSEETVSVGLLDQHPPGEILRTRVTFINNDRIEMLDLGKDAEPEYLCIRQSK